MMSNMSKPEIERQKHKRRARYFYRLRQRKKRERKRDLHNSCKQLLEQKLVPDVVCIILQYFRPITCTECKSEYMFERATLLFSPLPRVCLGCYEDCDKCVGQRSLITVESIRMPGYHVVGVPDYLGVLHATGCPEHITEEDWGPTMSWFGWNGQRGKT